MRLDDLVAAIRADDGAGEAVADPGLAAETRLRVMRSLETRARGRHQLVGVVTTLAILFAGTVSWALATGQVATLWSPAPPRVAPDVAPPAPPPPSPLPHRRHATAVDPTREVPRAADKAVEKINYIRRRHLPPRQYVARRLATDLHSLRSLC